MARIQLKSDKEIKYMREANLVVAAIHQALRDSAKPGVTTKQLDAVSAKIIESHGAKSNFLGYYDYPATVCISVNDTVVHGIPNDYALREGDLVSFDCGAYVERDGKQWHGDAAFSMIIGSDQKADLRTRQLNQVTELAMWEAVCSLWQGGRISCVGQAVEQVVAAKAVEYGWEADIVTEFVGHGIGTSMHMDPDVPNFYFRGRSEKLQPGMVLAIEPILTAGSARNKTLKDQWTVKTVDGSMACHWEHSVAIRKDGLWVLSAPDGGRAQLAARGVPFAPVE